MWGVGTGAYGLFLAVGAVGGLLGSLAANRLVRRFKSAQTLIAAGVVSGVGYLVMAVAHGWQLAARPSPWSASPSAPVRSCPSPCASG